MSQQRSTTEGLGTEDAYYVALGNGRYRSTIHAQGAWNEHEQHMAAASGLLAHCLDRHEPQDGLRIARLGYEIFGLIPAGEFEVRVTVPRPGRTIQMLQADLVADGRTAVRATAWRLQTSDTAAVAGTDDAAMPGPKGGEPWEGRKQWPGGFIASLEGVQLPGHGDGTGRAWLTTGTPLVLGEETPDWVRLMGLVDTANGAAPRLPIGPGGWMFPNIDLQIHLYRQPVGRRLGLSTTQAVGPDGVGLTSSVLHDEQGPFGRSEQILTVRRFPENV